MKRARFRKRTTKKSKLPIIPEILPGDRGRANWHVNITPVGAVPHTINHFGGEARISIPVEQKDAQVIQIHELLHAAHSPLEPPRPVEYFHPYYSDRTTLDTESITIAEEYRVNHILREKVGMDWLDANRDDETPDEIVDFWAKRATPETLTTLMKLHVAISPLHAWHPHDSTFIVNKLWKLSRDMAKSEAERTYLDGLYQTMIAFTSRLHDEILDMVNIMRSGPPFPTWKEFTLPLAYHLQKWLEKAPELHTQIQPGPTQETDDLSKLDRRSGRQNLQRPEQIVYPERARKPLGYTEPRPVLWGKMTIDDKQPKPVKLPGKLRMKSKYRASDMGVVPRNIHRSLIDGQVFSTKRYEETGSVLIDDSGSMALSAKNLQQIMELAPGTIIGKYSGRNGLGILTILAEDGKRVADDNLKVNRLGGNVVDGPAIEWLATQPEPRIWVTDSAVIPIQGGSAEAAAQCADFARKHNINVVENDAEALEIFQGTRMLYR